jgi:hypothetical protein
MAVLGTLTLDVLVFLLICIALILIGFFTGWFFKGRSLTDSETQETIKKPELSLERIVLEAANDKREEPYSNYCPKCGKQTEKKEQYCTKCGVDLIVKGHYPHNLF